MNKRTTFLSLFVGMAALGAAALVAAGAAFASSASSTTKAGANVALAQVTATVAPTATATAAPIATPLPTPVVTATQMVTGASRPAIAISNYFTIPVSQVVALHNSGWGYGEIFKLYGLALVSGKTVTEVKTLRDAGLGWGQIARSLNVHPGNAGFNLGAAMSDRQVIAIVQTQAQVANKPANKPVKVIKQHGQPQRSNMSNGAGSNAGKPVKPGKSNPHNAPSAYNNPPGKEKKKDK